MLEIIADLHIHTIASGHGADTIRTVCEFACKKNLKAIAITDHGPGFPGGAGITYFMSLHRLANNIIFPLKIITGIEDDIKNRKGELTISDDILKGLEIVMTGCHPFTWIAKQSKRVRTDAVVNAITNGRIKVFTHPVGTYIDIELKPVLDAVISAGAALELNTSKIDKTDVIMDLLEKCGTNNIPIVVNSDAHTADEVGSFDEARRLLDETGFPEHLVVNRSKESIKSFFDIVWK